MAALIAPGICRYTVNGEFNGRPVANIIDMQVDTTGTSGSRDDAIELIAGDILNNWSDHVLTLLTAQYRATSVSWVDLNSANGSTGERTTTDANTWPEAGGLSSGNAQGNVAYRINKDGTARRGQRAGRMYLCGVSEDANDNGNGNRVNASFISNFNTAMGEFLAGINDAEGPGDNTRQMVVLHVVAGVYEGYSDVNGLTIDPVFGSQRRRLRV